MKFLSSMYLHTVCQIIIKKPKKNDNLYYYGSDFSIDRSHAAKSSRKRIVLQDFDCQKLIFMGNKYYIRSQHARIHKKNYFSPWKISHENFACRGVQVKIYRIKSWGGVGRKFWWKYFTMKNKVFGVFLHADLEYHAYFP